MQKQFVVTLSFQLIRADFQETSKLFCNYYWVIVRLPILLESLQMLDMYGYVSTAQHFSPAARTGFQNGYSFFWKMSIHSSQRGLVFTKWFCFFGGGTFTDGFMCWTTLQNGFDVFSENEKKLIFFQGILLNGFIFFWIWPEVGVAFYKMVLVLF